jgi:hypothetical protein
MKKIFTLTPTLILSLFLGFGWNNGYFIQPKHQDIHTKSLSAPAAAIIPSDIIQEMIDQVDQERLLTDLRRLTGKEPICTSKGCTTLTGRETESDELQWAKDYVYETLVSMHYSVDVLDWDHDGYADQNIIATKPGLLYPDEEIYFIAHLDGYISDNPAADDDASGAVSLLELARVLSRLTLSRTVVIFFSTGEEHGSLGSYKFVEDYPERLAAIKYVVSEEMLGYDSNNDGVMELWNGTQSEDFVQLLVDIINAYPLGLEPQIVSGCT